MTLSLSSVTSAFSSLFQNSQLVGHYLGEIMQAGPDAFKLITDVLRAINDVRSGKITVDEFSVIIDDFKKLWGDFTATQAVTTTTTTTSG